MIITRERQKVIGKLPKQSTSMIIGKDNPLSLNADCYVLENNDLGMSFELGRWHTGHAGLCHGGISAYILDEVMGLSNNIYSANTYDSYRPVVTAEVKYKYLKPIPTGKRMLSFGRVKEADGRKHFCTGEIVDESGEVYVLGEGLFFEIQYVSAELEGKLLQFLPIDGSDPEFF